MKKESNMNRLYLIISLYLLFVTCNNNAHYTDVLDEADRLSDSIPSLALIKLEKIKNIKRLNTAEQAQYNLIFIKSMFSSGNRLSSDSIILDITQYYREQNDSVHLHQSLYYHGLYHYLNTTHDSAIAYFNKAIDAVPKGGENNLKAGYKRMAGYSHLYLGDAPAAVKTQKEAFQHALVANDSLSVVHSLLGLADAYRYNKEMEQSMETYMEALNRAKEKNNHDMEASILNIVAGIYESNDQIEEALHYKNRSQKVRRSRKDVSAANLYRAILFDKQNMPDSAQHYAQLSIKGDDQYVADLAYTFLSAAEARKGRYPIALNLSKNSEEIFSHFLTGIRSTEIQQKYEQQKLENENNQLKIKQREHQFYLIMALFLLVLMMIAIYTIRMNNKRKNEKTAHKNRLLQLEHENLLLKQQQEISALREKEAALRESLFKKINFFHKLSSLSGEENENHNQRAKIKITSGDWQELINGIQDAYPQFLTKLKQLAPGLSDDDVRFCCLLKINVNMQDLSDIYCVSKAAITKRKYRIKTEKFRIGDNSLNLDAVLQQIN